MQNLISAIALALHMQQFDDFKLNLKRAYSSSRSMANQIVDIAGLLL
jgi:hypothetical protein